MNSVVLQLARLGDLVQSLPLCQSLRRQGALTLVLAFEPGQLLRQEADRVVVLDLPSMARLRNEPGRLLGLLLEAWGGWSALGESCDLLCCLNDDPLVHLLSTMIPAREVRGAGQSMDGYHQWLHALPEFRGSNQLHLSEAMLSLGSPGPAGLWPRRTPGPGPVLVHPGSGSPHRRLPQDFWLRLIDGLLPLGREIVLTGSQAERATCAQILDKCPPGAGVVTRAGETTLDELCQLLDQAALLVAQDTGVLHLGAWRGTPLLGLYHASAWARETAPWQRGAQVVQATEACGPCVEGCATCGDFHCHEQLDPKELCALAQSLILDEPIALPPRPGRLHLRVEEDAMGMSFSSSGHDARSSKARAGQWAMLHGSWKELSPSPRRENLLGQAVADGWTVAQWRQRVWGRRPLNLNEQWMWAREAALLSPASKANPVHTC